METAILFTKHRWACTAIFLLSLALLTFTFRIYTYSEPLERDLTTYAVIGHELLKGRLFYSDLWDNKPPTIFGVYALAEWLVGYGRQQILFLNVLASWISLLGIYFAGCSLAKPWFFQENSFQRAQRTGFLAAIFWALLGLSYSIHSNQPNTEVFINGAVIWGFAMLTRVPQASGKTRYLFLVLAALFLGIGSLFKQVVLGIALPLAVAHGLIVLAENNQHASRSFVLKALFESSIILAGIPIMWGIMSGYFAATDRVGIYVKSTFEYASFYAGNPLENIIKGIKLSYLMPNCFWFSIPLYSVSVLGVFLGCISSSITLGSHPKPERPQYQRWRNWVYVSVLGMGSFLALSLPGKFFPHYYQLWLPYLSLATALGILEIQSRIATHFSGNQSLLRWVAPAVSVWALSGLFIVLFVWHPWIGLGPDKISQKKYGDVFVHCRDIGEEIQQKTNPRTRLYHWGQDPGVYFYARRDPMVGVLWADVILYGPLQEEFTQRTLAQINQASPDYVVVDMKYFQNPAENAVSKWIEDHYMPDPRFASHGQFRIYVRTPKKRGLGHSNRFEGSRSMQEGSRETDRMIFK